MTDFTRHTFEALLRALLDQQYTFQTFRDYLAGPKAKCIILRHDVDKRPGHSLKLARMEHEMGINGVYYFRAVPESWDDEIIKKIASLGHEVGYHYENLPLTRGDVEKAYEDFKQNLSRLRKLVPVATIAMHGSPRSKHDPKDLWKHYDYKKLGIIGEPYFDIDFSKVLYLTDTGRRWDGHKVSIRDRVNSELIQELTKQGYSIQSTPDLIKAINNGALPDRVMINVHPQRWDSNPLLWTRELVTQNLKNVVKRALIWTR